MQSRYVVVYQMGKVASTSIVATLDALDGIDAVQSHFLGEKALADIIPSITNAGVSQYFFKHQLGQFLQNIRITRRVNQIRAGQTRLRLLIISLTREPLDWARSSFVQDIEGYLPGLKQLLANQGITPETDEEIVEQGLTLALNTTCDILEANGGVDAFLAAPRKGQAAFADTPFAQSGDGKRIFHMLLRPIDWLPKHFEPALGIRLGQMQQSDGILEYSDDQTDYVIVRYEDMQTSLPAYLTRIGLPEVETFKRENTSGAKAFAQDVANAFKSPAGQRLAALLRDTDYARTFGYTAH